MKRTIDISLQGSDTNVTLSQDFTTQRMVMVSLSKAGFTSNSDGSNRSITVSFGTLQTEVRWGDIANKPNGKLFGGVITPDSAIPTTNADVYYMAYEAGFYTNFGFTLAEGTMAFVYRFGNGWTRTTVSMDTVGFVQGTRENQTYFGNSEMDELRKSVAFYYGREGFFMKTEESDEVMTFTLVASAINIDGANVASFYLRGARMFVNKTPNEGTNDYYHWFDGESTQFYLKDAMDQMAAYFEENKQDTLTFDSTPTEGSTNPVQSGGVYEALANLLADGCLYGGIVNPNSEPSDDKRFFYIAETQGVYTHFDNLELNGNSLFIIHWDNYFETWIMDSFGENHEGIEQDIAQRFNLLYLDLGFDRFSPHASYSAYDYVTNIEIGGLWRFNTNHHGVWNENDVDQVTLVDYIDDLLNRKQDVILDLATIRSGAAAGATAIQSSEKGTASGVATLDSGGKVPQSQLPSYVDDVLEYANIASFPANGESGKIYVALDTNKTYRWSGSTYVEISQSLAIGETESTAFAGNRGKAIEEKIPSNASPSNKLATEREAVPKGGTTGQILSKHSDDDNDVEWIDPPEGGGTGDYEELDNKPSINGVTLEGDLETEDLNIEALTNEEIDQLLV